MKPKLIYIEWDDPSSSETKWVGESELGEVAEAMHTKVLTCGFLVEETKEYLLLADYFSPPDEEHEALFNYLHKILKKCILKRKVIKK